MCLYVGGQLLFEFSLGYSSNYPSLQSEATKLLGDGLATLTLTMLSKCLSPLHVE